MAQSDYNLTTAQTFENYNAKVNSIISALRSKNSGRNFPSVSLAFDEFIDEVSGDYYIRSSDDSSWVLIGNINQQGFGILTSGSAGNLGPNRNNVYPLISDTLIAGDNVTLDKNLSTRTITINAEASGSVDLPFVNNDGSLRREVLGLVPTGGNIGDVLTKSESALGGNYIWEPIPKQQSETSRTLSRRTILGSSDVDQWDWEDTQDRFRIRIPLTSALKQPYLTSGALISWTGGSIQVSNASATDDGTNQLIVGNGQLSGDLPTLNVNTSIRFRIFLPSVEDLPLLVFDPESMGGSSFVANAANLYGGTSAIIQAGTNITIDRDSNANTLTINSTASGGGGSFTPSQANLYSSVKAILEGGTGIQVRPLDATNKIQFNAIDHRYVPTDAEIFPRFGSILEAGTNVTFDTDNTDHTITINSKDTIFTPSQPNLYPSVKPIIVGGNNVTVTPDDNGNTLTISSSGGGGGSFTPSQQNLYSSVKDILIDGEHTVLEKNDSNNTIKVDVVGNSLVVNARYVNTGTQRGKQDNTFGAGQGSFQSLSTANVRIGFNPADYVTASLYSETLGVRLEFSGGPGATGAGYSPVRIITDDSRREIEYVFPGIGDSFTVGTIYKIEIFQPVPILSRSSIYSYLNGMIVGGNNVTVDLDNGARTLTINSSGGSTDLSGVNAKIATLETDVEALEQSYDERSHTLSGYSYNTSPGVTKGQFHTQTVSGVYRLVIALKDGESIPSDYQEAGTFINFLTFQWQIMRVLTGDGSAGTSITFVVRDTADNSNINSVALRTSSLSFTRGITLRATALENRVDVTEAQHFIPSKDNFYPTTSEIIKAGTNITINRDSTNKSLTINSTASGGGGSSFTPSQQNLYSSVKDILVPGVSTTLSENDSSRTIAVNYDTTQNVRGQVSFLYSDGTSESISRFHPVLLQRLFGATSGVGITPTARRTDIRFLISGFIPGFTSLSQLVHFNINGLSARSRSTALEKGEYVGGNIFYDGTKIPGAFSLIGSLTNAQLNNLITNPSEVSFDVRYTVNSQDDIWSLRVPFLTNTEATASPIIPHIPIENVKNGVDIDQVAFSASSITGTKSGENVTVPLRLNLNSGKTKAAVTNLTIPVGSGGGGGSGWELIANKVRRGTTLLTLTVNEFNNSIFLLVVYKSSRVQDVIGPAGASGFPSMGYRNVDYDISFGSAFRNTEFLSSIIIVNTDSNNRYSLYKQSLPLS